MKDYYWKAWKEYLQHDYALNLKTYTHFLINGDV